MCWKCTALKIWGLAVVISQCTTTVSSTRSCARAYVHVNWICDHLIYKSASGSHHFPNTIPLCVCMCVSVYSKRGFFHSASSDCLTKRTPLGMHELTCCIFMPHISWLRTMSREASQALSCPCWVSRALGGGGDPMGCREGGQLWTLRKSLGDQWPHWCRAQKKLPTGMMSYFTCQPSSQRHSEESQTVRTTLCTWQLYLYLIDSSGLTYESSRWTPSMVLYLQTMSNTALNQN